MCKICTSSHLLIVDSIFSSLRETERTGENNIYTLLRVDAFVNVSERHVTCIHTMTVLELLLLDTLRAQ